MKSLGSAPGHIWGLMDTPALAALPTTCSTLYAGGEPRWRRSDLTAMRPAGVLLGVRSQPAPLRDQGSPFAPFHGRRRARWRTRSSAAARR
jgi:hypothetical protein